MPRPSPPVVVSGQARRGAGRCGRSGWPWRQPRRSTSIAGQNAFLTLALLLGGVGLLGRRDFAAGAILGLLSYKPQLALMVPVALLAARHWRALAGAAVSASFAVALSAATFGLAPWWDWLGHTLPGGLMGGAGDLAWSKAGTTVGPKRLGLRDGAGRAGLAR